MSLPAAPPRPLASAAVREGLADAVYTRLATPIGPLVVVQGARGVLRIAFEDEPPTRARPSRGRRRAADRASDRELAATRDTLSAYLEGDDDRLDLPVDLSLVRSAVPPRGARALHRRSAAARSSPTARWPRRPGTRGPRARSAPPAPPTRSRSSCPATACCRARGGVGGYGGGPERKRALLALEGATVR